MEESEDKNLDDHIKERQQVTKAHSSDAKTDDDEGLISEGSISEHITSTSGSVEHDRSLQEIEIFNQPSAFSNIFESDDHISQEPKPDSLDLGSFSSNLTNGLPDNTNQGPKSHNTSSEGGPKNAKSILEEILTDAQFNSEKFDNTTSKDDSFNIFANVDFSDKSLIIMPSNNSVSIHEENPYATFNLPVDLVEDEKHTGIGNKIKYFEEIVAVKDSTIHALTQELDSFREMSNPTYTSSMVSATEYRQLQEDCQNKILEYNSAIIFKNDLIEKLSESLDQSVFERKELLTQVETLKEEVSQLKEKLQVEQEHGSIAQKDDVDNEVPKNCSINQKTHENELMLKLQEEIVDLKDKMKQEKEDYDTEIKRLRGLLDNIKYSSTELVDLRDDLEQKHAKEVEELRTYFEKKCAELEKNYSEEVFSQQSRKMSGSSSDIELSADFLLSSQPGPGGDHNKVLKSKEDVEKLKETLANFLNKLSKHPLEDITDKQLRGIENEVKNELNTLFKIGEKLEIKAIENKYLEEISNLKFQLEEDRRKQGTVSVSSAIQEVPSSGDYELNEVVESYERRLQEQITLAKIDLINALEAQVQRLVSNEADDEDWPSELLQLRDRFTDKYEMEIKQLKEEHEYEISKLKEEHLKILNGALERARRRSFIEGDSSNKSEMELLKERDSLNRQVISLRNLLSELVKYFSQAEDELNNTLVDNLLKQNDTLNLDQLEEELNLDISSNDTANSSKLFESLNNRARFHLTPNFGELISMIEHQSQRGDESIDISVDLKNELGSCLEKLKQEANAILALTAAPKSKAASPRGSDVEKLATVSKQLMMEIQHKEKLKQELLHSNEIITSLEKENNSLEFRVNELLERLTLMESDLEKARYKIAELIEHGHSEVISEGYGEEGSPTLHGLGDTMKALSDLQEKARAILIQSRSSADPNILQLIEALCRVGEKIKEESKKESTDLLQQIEAADKKYRTTQKFLEEQAAEREQERDEFQKKIDALHEQLKERDKDRANCQIMSSEHHVRFSCRPLEVDSSQAEHLEQQINNLTHQLEDYHHKYKELEDERDEAVEKIKLLRDIIGNLENQNDAKDREIQDQLRNIQKLECIVEQQNQTFDEYKTLNSVGDVSDIQGLQRHCDELEKEVQRLRLAVELTGSEGALRQIKLQIHDLGVNLDKKTKELELLHSTGTNSCSSTSEDMSIRELVRPQTPNSGVMDECEVPLQQLARLKEKLLKHSRAEEAAIKRIHDLEMQVATLRTETEEAHAEKEFLKRQIQEQLVLISDFQIRLDQQRIKAEHIEKQTNTSLESRIYDLEHNIQELQEKLRSKDKTINNQEQVIKETQQRLHEVEIEMATAKDDELVVELQKEVEALRRKIQTLNEHASTDHQILPNLVENIIQDKNKDIEKLREKLNETEQLLYSYTSLNLDKNDLNTLANLKNSGGSIEQLISILDLSQPVEQMRRCELSSNGDFSGANQVFLKKGDETEFLGSSSEPEISSIEKVGPPNLHYTMVAPLGKPNSTEVGHKKVHFEDTVTIEKLTQQIEALRKELDAKNKVIKDVENNFKLLNEFEAKITKLQERLEETELGHINATKIFEKEHEEAREREQKLGIELAEKKMHLSELEKEVKLLKQELGRKDEMCLDIAREKRDIEKCLSTLKKDSAESLDLVIKEKSEIIEHLKAQQVISLEQIERMKVELEQQKQQLTSLLAKIDNLQAEKASLETAVASKNEENIKLTKELENKAAAIEHASLELESSKGQINSNVDNLKRLQNNLLEREETIKQLLEDITKKDDLVKEKDCLADILNEDLNYYQEQMIELENKVKSLEDPSRNKQMQEAKLRVSELTKELAQLQDLVREKDRVIGQMTEDHKQVHLNLKAIDSKIKETGNIFDLSNRLKTEQRKNADLYLEIHKLKANLLNYEVANAAPVEEITGQVKKELECAAQIDSNILSVVSDQSLSSISEGHETEVYIKSLSRQKALNKQFLRKNDQLEKEKLILEQQCNKFNQRLNEVHNALEKEKLLYKQAMIEDAKLMEQLRIKLEGALDTQEQLERLLEEERRCRKMLEVQCEEMKKPSSSSESTKYKSLPTQAILDINHLKQELQIVKDEKDKLIKENRQLQQNNNELENNVKYTKEMLMLEAERNRTQEEKLRMLAEKERSLSDELLRKKFELETKERDMEESKIKMDELEQEKSLLKKQKADLIKALKTQTAPPILGAHEAVVPETLEKLIKELKEKSDENKRRLEYIEQIENEKRVLESQLRNEVTNSVNGNMPFSDLVARCNYLFAKALKLESVKKALIWQKRYLVDFLQCHQRHCLIEILPNQPHENHCLRRRHPPIQHFRAAVYAIISIERMRFLVKRWHTGMRKYERINARHYQRSKDKYLRENPGVAANFHVGQPVSNQNFTQSSYVINLTNPFHRDVILTNDNSRPVSPALSVVSTREAPWSGSTPPSKENTRHRPGRIGSRTATSKEFTPLQTPQLLTQLHERVEQIQETLSIPFSTGHNS